MIFLFLFLLVLALVALIVATNNLIGLIKALGLRVNIPPLVISSIFLAVATSLPELSVGVISALEGEQILSLGNVLGANITNVTLVLGVASIVAGRVKSGQKLVMQELFVSEGMALLPFVLLLDRILSFTDGLLLLAVYIFYSFSLMKKRHHEVKAEPEERQKSAFQLSSELLLWLAVLIASAQIIVDSSTMIAQLIKLPLLVIGFFLVALGTTLPELIVGLKTAEKHESGILFGNILGSIAVNSTLILGLVAVISPIIVVQIERLILSGVFLLVTFLILPVLMHSKRRIDRREGIFLLAIYISFLLTEFLVVK